MSCIPSRVLWLQRVIVVFAALLMASTWPLWLPPTSTLTAQIPWLSILKGAPAGIDWLGLGALSLGGLLLVIDLGANRAKRLRPDQASIVSSSSGGVVQTVGGHQLFWNRLGWGLFSGGLCLLVLLDQHRLQPWVCQFLLMSAVLFLAPTQRGLQLCQLVVASIYFWSAISKFDQAFLTSHGELLLQGLLAPFRSDQSYWQVRSRPWLVALFPVAELVVSLLLFWNRGRRVGLIASLLMHLALLWTLGIGLKHEWGVLLWNIYFLVQNCLLFGSPESSTASSLPAQDERARAAGAHFRLAQIFTAIAVCYPVLEPIGYCDHWPGWAVYSSRPAQVRVWVDQESVDRLPPEYKRFLGRPELFDDRVPFSLDAWSFHTYSCPVYPQLRYRLGLIRAMLIPRLPEDALSVEIAFTPDRWTGRREKLSLSGTEELKRYCDQFWGNTEPRNLAAGK